MHHQLDPEDLIPEQIDTCAAALWAAFPDDDLDMEWCRKAGEVLISAIGLV